MKGTVSRRMKLTTTEMTSSVQSLRHTWGVCAELVKARLTALVLLTTLTGFLLGVPGAIDYRLLLAVLLGTGLLAGGASVLNQYLERNFDRLMERTRDRPIPSGEFGADRALSLGLVLAFLGILVLIAWVNPTTCLLGAITLVLYAWIYTPLKRITSLNTLIGAIPGALPPLMGWTAARGNPDLSGWILPLILFLWQIPHFMAIAWMYRDQYRSAGFRMLPGNDPGGRLTGGCSLGAALALLPVSLVPLWLDMAGMIYVSGALVLSLAFVSCALLFLRNPGRRGARRLFLFSIIYLPLILGLIVFDKVNPA